MSKPCLRLIHCSDGIRPEANHRPRGRGFRPLVIHGGARARSVPRESSWEAALELINLGPLDIALYPNMPICQLIIEQVNGIPFSNESQFQGQATPGGVAPA